MDSQTLINAGITVAIAAFGWFARTIWDAVNELKRDVHQIEVDLPNHYVQKNEFGEAIRRIEAICERIFDRLDNKADK